MHFAYLTAAGLVGLATLVIADYGHRKCWWKSEAARKVAHMLVAVQVAMWPLYLYWYEIRLISIALTIGVVISYALGLFGSFRKVGRNTYGEIAFTITIGLLTFLTSSELIYAMAILHLGLADGLAALVGKRFGKKSQFKAFGQTKSLVGSATFFAVSLIILSAYGIVTGGLSWWAIGVGGLAATALEAMGVYGLDNVLVPVFIVALLGVV